MNKHKPNLGSVEAAVQRHIDKESISKRKKRDNVITKRRRGGVVTNQPEENEKLNKALKLYNVSKFIKHKEQEQFEALATILHEASAANLEIHIGDLLKVGDRYSIIEILVESLMQDKAHRGIVAVKSLIEITGAELLEATIIPIIAVIITSPFLKYAVVHMQEETSIVADLWLIISNMVSTCTEARDAVFNAPLIGDMLVTRLSRGDTGGEDHTLLTLICGALRFKVMPSEPWIATMWPYLVRFAELMFPEPYREDRLEKDSFGREDKHVTGIELLLGSIRWIVESARDEFCLALFQHTPQIIPFLVKLIPRLTDSLKKTLIAKILIVLQCLRDDTSRKQAHEAGVLRQMIGLSFSNHYKVKRVGIMWLSVFASEGVPQIMELLENDAFKSVAMGLRQGTISELMDESITLFTNACRTCLIQKADGCLGTFINDYQILPVLTMYVGGAGHDRTTTRILQLFRDLIKWKPEFVIPILDGTDAINKSTLLLGDNNVAVASMAEQVHQLLDKNQRLLEDGNMDVDEDDDAVEETRVPVFQLPFDPHQSNMLGQSFSF